MKAGAKRLEHSDGPQHSADDHDAGHHQEPDVVAFVVAIAASRIESHVNPPAGR